jgi:hypothetical protein
MSATDTTHPLSVLDRRGASDDLRLAQRAPIGVLVVDDHPAVRSGLVQLLDGEPDLDVVAVASTAEGAVGEAAHKPSTWRLSTITSADGTGCGQLAG